jgi:hypothetical protein
VHRILEKNRSLKNDFIDKGGLKVDGTAAGYIGLRSIVSVGP